MTIFIQDTSTQTTATIASNQRYTTQAVPNINFNGSSGIYNPTADNVRIFTNNLDGLTIDNNQCLYGNATGLTHLQYNNIDGKPDLSVYATTSNLNSLSSGSTLSINNLNSTSTTIFNNVNSLSTNSTLSINNLNSTSTSIFGIVNTHTTGISYLNATSTTTFTNLNSLSTNSTLSINNLNSTSTSMLGILNTHTTNISFLNTTSTTIFSNLNSLSTNSILSINNLNATSTTILGILNTHTTSISNLNTTSTTIFSNLNSLSTSSILSINNLNATSNTIFNNIYNFFSNVSTFSTDIKLSSLTNNISNLQSTSTTILNNLNSLSSASTLNVVNLYITGTSKFNGATTCLSSLNIVGQTTLTDCQIQGITKFPVNGWLLDSVNNQRIYFDNGAKTYFKSAGTTASSNLDGFIFRNGQAVDLLNIDGSANISCLGTLNVTGATTFNSDVTFKNGSVLFTTPPLFYNSLSFPTASTNGTGKLLLNQAVGSGTYPCDIGVATGPIMWMSAPSNGYIVDYIGGAPINQIGSGGCTMYSNLNVSGSLNVAGNTSINGFLTCGNRWVTLSTNFSFAFGPTTYCATFYFNNYPNIVNGKTFLIDCQITQNGLPTSIANGFSQIVNNYGITSNGNVTVKTLYNHNNIAVNWYNAFTTWNDGLNVYTYGTNLPTLVCTVRLTVLG